MKKGVRSELSINIKIPNQFEKIFLTLSFLLTFIFMVQIVPVYADGAGKGNRDFKGHESAEGYYPGEGDFREGAGDKKGNEATGMIAAILLVVANVTV